MHNNMTLQDQMGKDMTSSLYLVVRFCPVVRVLGVLSTVPMLLGKKMALHSVSTAAVAKGSRSA